MNVALESSSEVEDEVEDLEDVRVVGDVVGVEVKLDLLRPEKAGSDGQARIQLDLQVDASVIP
jgi:hypothetical protein